nr:ABC transporter substrate-binding protein [Geodermatophilus sabuli]
MLADTMGFFEEQGLDVTFEETQGSAPAINTVIAEGALLTRVGDIETIDAIVTRDAPLLNIGSVEKGGGLLRFISSSRQPIETPEDLEGTTMGLPSIGGTSEKTLDLVLASADVPRDSVERQAVGLAPGVFELVLSGRIDGFVVSLDTALTLEKQQPEAVAFAPSDFIESGNQLYMTSRDQAADEAKADQLRRFTRAIEQAIAFMVEDEANGFTETIDSISSAYDVPSFADREVAAEALTFFVDAWTADGLDRVVETNPDTWQATYDELVDAGIVAAGEDPSDWITDEFAPDGS